MPDSWWLYLVNFKSIYLDWFADKLPLNVLTRRIGGLVLSIPSKACQFSSREWWYTSTWVILPINLGISNPNIWCRHHFSVCLVWASWGFSGLLLCFVICSPQAADMPELNPPFLQSEVFKGSHSDWHSSFLSHVACKHWHMKKSKFGSTLKVEC